MKTTDRELKSDRRDSSNNKSKLLWGLSAIPILLGVLVTWGLIEPYFIDEEEETAVVTNLPPEWSGKKVAQVSDFQVGMWWDNTPTIARSVERLIEEQPAAVLISGDFIYHARPNPEKEINEVIELIRPLTEANIPTYAVLGNHDYGMKGKNVKPDSKLAAQLETALENAGIKVLNNEAVKIPLQGQDSDLYLVGVDAHWANNDRVDQALAQISSNSPRIAMMHNPKSFEAFPANTAPFAVAGHTHGGQIRLPFLPQWSWLSFPKGEEVHTDKWVEEDYGQPGNSLYVNRGIGFSEIPIRINCSPEITLFTLKSEGQPEN